MFLKLKSSCRILVSIVGYKDQEKSSSLDEICAFELNGITTSTHLNALPLGSYSMLLGMD